MVLVIPQFTLVIGYLPNSSFQALVDCGSEVFVGGSGDDILAVFDCNDQFDIMIGLRMVEYEADGFNTIEISVEFLSLVSGMLLHGFRNGSMSNGQIDLHVMFSPGLGRIS
tara:strand:+ start:115 stop:447 length:333 start_codon:yes stop_codon:yes gene_type:complete